MAWTTGAMPAINPPQWDHTRCQASGKNVNISRKKKSGDISQRMWFPGFIWNESCHWKSGKSGERMAFQGRKIDLRKHEIRTQHLVGNDAVCGRQMKKRFSKPVFIFYLFILFNFYFILLYNTVLVLPYIDMNPPQVYTSSQSWIPLPPPSLYHLEAQRY